MFIEKNIKYQQHLFVSNVIEGKREMSDLEFKTRVERLELDWLEAPFVTVIISPDYSFVDYKVKDDLICNYDVYVRELLNKTKLNYYSFTDSYNNITILLSLNKFYELDLNSYFINIRECLIRKFENNIFIGIGSIVNDFKKIPVSSLEALDMLGYKYSYADKGIINVSNIIKFQSNINTSYDITFDRVIGCFKDGNIDKMIVRLNELVEQIRNKPNFSRTNIKRTLAELLIHILHTASSSNIDVDKVLNDEDPYRWIMRQEHTEVITEWIINISKELIIAIADQKKTNENSVIKNAQKYIEDNICNPDIGLQSVSKYIGLTSTYFSQLFKNVTGIGINSFILQKRINIAQKLLEETNMAVVDISKQLGFASAGYFSQCFKKNTGKTPIEYRRDIIIKY